MTEHPQCMDDSREDDCLGPLVPPQPGVRTGGADERHGTMSCQTTDESVVGEAQSQGSEGSVHFTLPAVRRTGDTDAVRTVTRSAEYVRSHALQNTHAPSGVIP